MFAQYYMFWNEITIILLRLRKKYYVAVNEKKWI